jgi:hypothetical protein
MADFVFYIFSFISIPILLIGVILGLYYFTRLSPLFKFLFLYFGLALGFDVFHRFLTDYNLFLQPIYGAVELFVFSLIYEKCLLKKKSKIRFIIRILIYMLLAYDFLYTAINMELSSYNAYGMIIMDIYILTCGILYYRKVFTAESFDFPKTHLLFNANVLVYFGFNLLFYASINFLVNNRLDIVIWFWLINAILIDLFNIFNIFLLWQTGKTRKHLQFG